MRDSNKPNRREVLKGTGIVATTLALGASPVTGGAYASKNKVSLPKLTSGDKVIKKFTVPKEWDAHRRNAKSVHNSHSFLDQEGILATGLQRSGIDHGGKSGLQITLYVRHDFGNHDDIPEEIDKIPISINELEKGAKASLACGSTDSGNCVNYDADTYVEGGEYISGATACCQGTNTYFGEDRLLTAAHLFYDYEDGSCASASDVNGTKVSNYCGGDNECEWIGEVEKCNIEDDWAIIEPYDHTTISSYIDYVEDKIEVDGVVSEACLQEWESRWKYNRPCLYSMGTTSSKTSGKLKHANFALGSSAEGWITDCVSYQGDGSKDGVYTYCDVGEGDSGGPTWHEEDGLAYLVNVNCAYHYFKGEVCGGKNVASDSSGIAGYEIENDNLWFEIP